MLRPLVFLTILSTAFAVNGSRAADELDQTLDRIFGAKKEFDPKRFGPARWLNQGTAYTTLERPAESKVGHDVVRYEAESGRREILVTAARLTPPGKEAKPLVIEDYAWSADGQWLLVFANAQKVWRNKTRGDYWVLELATGKLRQLGGGAPAATLMFAKFSPDNTRVAYVRANNLYVENLRSGAVKPLTKDGSTTLINGTSDWVNEEELGLRDCFSWSDDSRSIAYWQFDTSGVREFTLSNTTSGLYPVLTQFPYPKVGTQNSAVKIGVVAATGGRTRWMELPGDPRQRYVARMGWLANANEIVIHQLNRLQNVLDAYVADARSGKVSPLFRDEDKAWVSVREGVRWTRDGRTMFILSERNGWQQAFAVKRPGREMRPVTPGSIDALGLHGTDAGEEWLYYTASPEQATQRYLFRARTDGTGTAQPVTPPGFPGTHSYVLSPDGRYAIHTYATFDRPPVIDLVRLPSHEVIRVLEENRPLQEKLAPRIRPTEFFQIAAGGGVTLDGWMMRPQDFDAQKRYPVLVYVYGETASVTVTDNWAGSRGLFHRALADAGYIVVSLDNRGTPSPKGREWRKVVYGEVNVLAAQEQAAALKNLLAERPYLDAARVAVWGWSGGGSNTLNLMFRSPELYHVGIAVAPVTDQLLYDSIYQERYMGLPDQNKEGYKKGSPITFAEGLQGKLLLVHGAADDNVHYQASERLMNRLIELQKPFDLMVYPNGTHAISEGKGYSLHLHRLIARYLRTNLPAGGR